MFVTCDTNFYRKIVENIDVNNIDQLKQIAETLINAEQKNNIVTLMNPIVAEELLHHLLDDTKSKDYKSCLKAIVIMGMHCFDKKMLCPRVNPSPSSQVAHLFFGYSCEYIDKKIASVICDISKDIKNIDNHLECIQNIKKHINDSEEGVVENIETLCKNIDPNFSNWNLFYKEPSNRKKYLDYIRSDEFTNITAYIFLAYVKLIIQTTKAITENDITTFTEMYKVGIELRRYFYEQILTPNFDLTQKSRVNFFWDEQILFAVGNTIQGNPITLVTSDKKIIDAATKTGYQKFIKSFDDYMNFLGIADCVITK